MAKDYYTKEFEKRWNDDVADSHMLVSNYSVTPTIIMDSNNFFEPFGVSYSTAELTNYLTTSDSTTNTYQAAKECRVCERFNRPRTRVRKNLKNYIKPHYKHRLRRTCRDPFYHRCFNADACNSLIYHSDCIDNYIQDLYYENTSNHWSFPLSDIFDSPINFPSPLSFNSNPPNSIINIALYRQTETTSDAIFYQVTPNNNYFHR